MNPFIQRLCILAACLSTACVAGKEGDDIEPVLVNDWVLVPCEDISFLGIVYRDSRDIETADWSYMVYDPAVSGVDRDATRELLVFCTSGLTCWTPNAAACPVKEDVLISYSYYE